MVCVARRAQTPMTKSLLLLFFRKEDFSFLRGSAAAKRMEGALLGLYCLTALLLVGIPALIYLIGWVMQGTLRKGPSWIGFPAARGERAEDEWPPRDGA